MAPDGEPAPGVCGAMIPAMTSGRTIIASATDVISPPSRPKMPLVSSQAREIDRLIATRHPF